MLDLFKTASLAILGKGSFLEDWSAADVTISRQIVRSGLASGFGRESVRPASGCSCREPQLVKRRQKQQLRLKPNPSDARAS